MKLFLAVKPISSKTAWNYRLLLGRRRRRKNLRPLAAGMKRSCFGLGYFRRTCFRMDNATSHYSHLTFTIPKPSLPYVEKL